MLGYYAEAGYNLLAEKATGEALRAVRNIYANKSLFINQVP